jgi:cbb3-type cytochrome oxidase subunit 3
MNWTTVAELGTAFGTLVLVFATLLSAVVWLYLP